MKGSCLCGKVRYEVAKVPLLSHCHCSMCRKAHGAAYATFASVLPQDFRFLAGEAEIVRYQSSANNVRNFCRSCGSNLPKLNRRGSSVVIPAGGLDDDPVVRPALHIFVGSKAPWHEIGDALPQFEKWVPGFGPDDED